MGSGSTPAVQLEVHDESRWGASTMLSHIDRLESVAPDVGAHESILKRVQNPPKLHTEEMQSLLQSSGQSMRKRQCVLSWGVFDVLARAHLLATVRIVLV